MLRDTAALLGRRGPGHGSSASPGEPAPDATLQRVTEAAAAVLQRLKQTERDALRAEQLAWVGQMAAGIAHEVRNPLTAIKLLVQAATDPRRTTGFRPRDLQVLEGEILRLEQIISAFLDFARPPRPDKKPVAVPELLTECLAGVRARAELQSVDVALDAAAACPALDADAARSAGHLQPDVQRAGRPARRRDDPGQRWIGTGLSGRPPTVIIRVEDTGPGLPAGLERPDLRSVRQHQGRRDWGWGCRFRGGSSRHTAGRSKPATDRRWWSLHRAASFRVSRRAAGPERGARYHERVKDAEAADHR